MKKNSIKILIAFGIITVIVIMIVVYMLEKNKIDENKTLVEAFNSGELQIGDYVDYKPDTEKTYTSKTEENGWMNQTYEVDKKTTWRVLGIENGHILLISGSPIKKVMNPSSENEWDKDPYLYIKGAYAYVNCEKMLNSICEIYSTELGTARSITMEDIDRACGVKVERNRVYLESDEKMKNIDQANVLGQIYTYKESDYSPESYIDGKKKATAGETVIGTAYGYDILSMRDKKIGSTTLGSLLFDKTGGDDNYRKGYWLASPGIRAFNSYALFRTRIRGQRCWEGVFKFRIKWVLEWKDTCGTSSNIIKF